MKKIIKQTTKVTLTVEKRDAFDQVVSRMQRVLKEEREEIERLNHRIQMWGAKEALEGSDCLVQAGATANRIRKIAYAFINTERSLEQCVRDQLGSIEYGLLTGSSDYSMTSTELFHNAVSDATRTADIRLRNTLQFWLEIFEDEKKEK